MQRRLSLSSILICVCIASLQAQSLSIDSAGKIEHMDKLVMLKLAQSTEVEKFGIRNDRSHIKLSPNANSMTTLSVNYRFISFQLSYLARFLPGNNDYNKRGKTRSGKINFSLNHKHWLNDFSYGRTKGYYLENTADFDPTWDASKAYIQFPDLQLTQYQIVSGYKFNPQYSVNAIATQTERQTKSAGSFIPQARLRYYINDDRSAIPAGGFTQKAKNLEVMLGAGYHYTFVLNKSYYLAVGIAPHVGIVFSRIFTRGLNETLVGNQRNLIFRFDGRTGAGYNGKRIIGGVYFNLAASAFRQSKTSVTTENDRTAVQVFVGYRLSAPKPLIRLVSAIQSKLDKTIQGKR
jgi:hypothetical protein